MEATNTKRDRQRRVRLLIKFKKNQKKLAFHSKELKKHLLSLSSGMRSFLGLFSLQRGEHPNYYINELMKSSEVFKECFEKSKKILQLAKKQVKNKDYKDE
jgi:hypothetical protein